MRKIGITFIAMLALAASACAESPTAGAAGVEASLDGSGWEPVYPGEGSQDPAGSGDVVGTDGEDAQTAEGSGAGRNPGLGLTGH